MGLHAYVLSQGTILQGNVQKYQIERVIGKGSFGITYLATVINDGAADKDGIDKKVVYPHSFRHRFAKNFLERYNDIALLADLMGHESIETTRIYLRKTASEQQQIVDRIVNW